MCRAATVRTLAQLVGSYNHHFCTVLAGEVPETLENLSTSCLCSLHNYVV